MTRSSETSVTVGHGKRQDASFAAPAGRVSREGNEGIRRDHTPPVGSHGSHFACPPGFWTEGDSPMRPGSSAGGLGRIRTFHSKQSPRSAQKGARRYSMDSLSNRDSGSHNEFQEVKSRLRSVKGTRGSEKNYHETYLEETERSASAMDDLEQMIDDALEQQSALRKERGFSTMGSSRNATLSGANQPQAVASRSHERAVSSERDSYQHLMESSRSHEAQQHQSFKSHSNKGHKAAGEHWSDHASTRTPGREYANAESKLATLSEEMRNPRNALSHSNEGPRSVRQRAAAFEKHNQSSRSKARSPKEQVQDANKNVPVKTALRHTKYSPGLSGNSTPRDEDANEDFTQRFGVESFDRAKVRHEKQHDRQPKHDIEVFIDPQEYPIHEEPRRLSSTIHSGVKQNDVNVAETTHAAEPPVTPTPSPQKGRPIARQISSFLTSKRGWVFQDKSPSTHPAESKESAHAAAKQDAEDISGQHEHSGERDSALDEFIRIDQKYAAGLGKTAGREFGNEMRETGRSTPHTSAPSRDTQDFPEKRDMVNKDRTNESHKKVRKDERGRANAGPKREPPKEDVSAQRFAAKFEETTPPVKDLQVDRLSPKRHSYDDKVDNKGRSSESYLPSEEKYSVVELADSMRKATQGQQRGAASKSVPADTSSGERHRDQDHEKSGTPSGDYLSAETMRSSANKDTESTRTLRESSSKQITSHSKNETNNGKRGVSSEGLSPVSTRPKSDQQLHSNLGPSARNVQTRTMRSKSRRSSDEARNVTGLSKVQRMARDLDKVSTSPTSLATSEARRSLESRIAASRRQSQAQAPAHATLMSPSSERQGDEFLSHQLKELHSSLPLDMHSPARHPAATTILKEEDEESQETDSAFNKSVKDASASLQVNLSATPTPPETPETQALTQDEVTEGNRMTSATITPVRGLRLEQSTSSPLRRPVRGREMDASPSLEPFPSPGLGAGVEAKTGIGAETSAALAKRRESLARRAGDSRTMRFEERYEKADTSTSAERRWEANSCVSVRVEVRTSPERVGYASAHAGWDKEWAQEETAGIHGQGHGHAHDHGHGDRVITVNASVTPRKESERGEEN